MDVKTNLVGIEQDIKTACEKVGRNPEEITLIAVTKYVTIERTKEAIQAGIKNIGENRLEGLLEKKQNIADEAIWHFIGSLQTRKVKDIIADIDAIHSVDRLSLAKEINKRAEKPVDCFVQVNVSGEESKQGVEPDELLGFIETLSTYENVRVVGLMTMAPLTDDETRLREVFANLAQLRNVIKDKQFSHAPCTYLSMGMSNDFQIAIEEGATHIRVGTKLVGAE